ncbi:hypothetical protein [Castellaniella sp.]|uniref:hypothetical protein n=1 Tax=Castellaniella sp. TaxID=1955812 RepID=UPI002AFDFDDC|nr:hypothetical protein [Castellaniella sp.]
MFYVKFSRNTGKIGPDSQRFGPYKTVEMLVDSDEGFSPILTCTTLDGAVIELAWYDYGGWYCDYDGDVYRAFEITHKD